jgi:hypothetical protein
MKFNKLGLAMYPDVIIDAYISEDKQLIIQKEVYKSGSNTEWVLKPNSNNIKVFSRFHGIFEGYVRGTLEHCIEEAQLYYKGLPIKEDPLPLDITFTVNISTFEDTHIVMKTKTHEGTVVLAFNVDQAQQLIKLFQDSIQSIQNPITNEKDNNPTNDPIN